jgi:hypothetical protein
MLLLVIVHRRILLMAKDNALAGPAFPRRLPALGTLRFLFVAFQLSCSTSQTWNVSGDRINTTTRRQWFAYQPVRDRMPTDGGRERVVTTAFKCGV